LNIDQLREAVLRLALITNEQWLASLSPRKKAELDFHNRDRDRTQAPQSKDDFDKYYANKKYYSTVARSTKYIESWIATQAKGKVFLDYACGNGFNAIKAARAGAALSIGIDISDTSIANARKDAEGLGLDNVVFVQADAENTKLPDDCIDVAICSGMLHHLDLSCAFPELRRLLAPGGKILAVEALNYNPFINLYRRFTPAMRTDWEKNHILGLSDIVFARRFFDVRDVRYWHITGYLGAHARWAAPVLDCADRVMESIPLLRLMAWIFTFELRSTKESASSIPLPAGR